MRNKWPTDLINGEISLVPKDRNGRGWFALLVAFVPYSVWIGLPAWWDVLKEKPTKTLDSGE